MSAAASAAASLTASLDDARPSGAVSQPSGLGDVLELLKSLDTLDLLKVVSTATKLATTAVKKAPSAAATASKRAKKGSKDAAAASDKPKRSGKQLAKPRAWMDYVKNDARANGWETFPVKKSIKDKLTKKVVSTETVWMPESVVQDGKHVFPDGKEFNGKHAMSLSTYYWGPKPAEGQERTSTEYGSLLRETFEAQYVAPEGEAADTEATTEADAETDD